MVFILLLLIMQKEQLSLKYLAGRKGGENGTCLESSSFPWEVWFLFTFNTSLDNSLDPSLATLCICRIWESFYMLLAALQVTDVQFTSKHYILLKSLVTIQSLVIKSQNSLNPKWLTKEKCSNIYGFKNTISVNL